MPQSDREQVRRMILDVVQKHPGMVAVDVVDAICTGPSESLVRRAIWDLIESRRVRLDGDLGLHGGLADATD